jgi:hypothetical protein
MEGQVAECEDFLHRRKCLSPRDARGLSAPRLPDPDTSRRSEDMQASQGLFAAALVTLGLMTSGCAAKRELVINSDPPGALVRLDDRVVGTTPYTTRFDAYGTRRITLYHLGYRSLSEVEEIDPPWYGVFPLDVISEVLIPVGWRDRHEFNFHMTPESGTVTAPDLEQVLDRAETLRLAEPTGPRSTTPATTPLHGQPGDASKPALPPSSPTSTTGVPETEPAPVKPSPVPEIPPPKDER